MIDYPVKTYIIGKTFHSAFKKAIELLSFYKKYDINIEDSELGLFLVIKLSNKEKIVITSFENFMQPHCGERINNIYFDRQLSKKEVFKFIPPYLVFPSSMWQF